MQTYRETTRGGMRSWLVKLLPLLVIVALPFALSGCAASCGTPVAVNLAPGIVHAAQQVTAWSGSTQQLDEYGIFYSTNRDHIVGLSGVTTMSAAAGSIATDVVQVSYLTPGQPVGDGQTATLTVTLTNLKQATRYYYRFYTVGPTSIPFASELAIVYDVGGVTTTSRDASLKSIKVSAGKLVPTFAKTRYSYSDTIAKSKSSVKITVASTVAGSKVQMKIGGGSWSTATSKVVGLSKGQSKMVFVRVTATDKLTVANYSVKVTRKKH
jgi:hypothetical protein